ncbi:MAG: glycosyltransferase [Thermoleophilia bacterium]|nr:glycosyltransferase [Thermoleophilia bacterium]
MTTGTAAARPGPGPRAGKPLVSVLMPVWNEAAHVEASVRSGLAQTGVESFEILVIDGGSTDGTAAIVAAVAAEDPRVRLLSNPHRRIPHALNIGLAQARGHFIARMDAHTSYPRGYLAAGVARLERGDVAWVSGPQLPVAAGGRTRDVVAALGTRLGVGGAEFRRAAGEKVVDSGFTGVLRADLLRHLGGWDEQWHINEDGEIAARVRAAGGRIVCVPEMAADYVPRGTLRGLAVQYHRYGMYRCKTARRHPSALRRTHLVPPVLLVAAAAAAVPVPGVRAAGRAGVAAFGGAVAVAAVRAPGPRSAPGVAAVLLTMHVSWALGFARGIARFGVPWRGLLRCAGIVPGSPGDDRSG